MSSPRIVIIGAGPAGAMLAYLLAGRGLTVTLIERQHDFEREVRGEVLMPSGIDVFRQAGLQAGLQASFATLPTNTLRIAEIFRHTRKVFTIDLERMLGTVVAFTAVSQPAMLEMLVKEASRFLTFTFERGAAVRQLKTENHRTVGVEFVRAGHAERLAANLVIGADGRASVTRRLAGLEVIRRPQAFDIVWCKVPLPADSNAIHRPDGAQVFIGNGHFALAFPSFDHRLQVAWVIRKGSIGELRRRGIEHWMHRKAAMAS